MLKLPDMIKNDLHIHSFRSRCGQDSYRDLEVEAREKGMTSIAVTDHGPDLGGMSTPSTYYSYKRTSAVRKGVRVFRGIESNLRCDGTTDVPKIYEKDIDIVLLGLHGTGINKVKFQYLPQKDRTILLPSEKSEAYYTDLLIKAVNESIVDAITHPYIMFPLCMDALVEVCKERGTAIELNNSSFKLGKAIPEKVKETIDAINKYQPRIILSSDAHTYEEIGEIDGIKTALERYPIEADVELVNATLESTEAFVKERKKLRQK